MAVNILHRGTLPQDRTYQANCSRCRTSFEFSGSDGKFMFDRNENVVVIKCPVCKTTVSANA